MELATLPAAPDNDLKYTGLQIRVVALAFLTALLDGLDLQIIAYAAPVMARDLRLTETSLGVIFSGGFAGLAAGSMFLAPLGDRFGRRTIMILCLVVFGLSVLATPLAQHAEQIFVLRVLTGVGLGGVMPNAVAISMEFSPARLRASMVSFTTFGFIIGGAAGGVVAASLIPLVGWKGMLFIVGALPLALALIEFFFCLNHLNMSRAGGMWSTALIVSQAIVLLNRSSTGLHRELHRFAQSFRRKTEETPCSFGLRCLRTSQSLLAPCSGFRPS